VADGEAAVNSRVVRSTPALTPPASTCSTWFGNEPVAAWAGLGGTDTATVG
jgi:hypothetical protein